MLTLTGESDLAALLRGLSPRLNDGCYVNTQVRTGVPTGQTGQTFPQLDVPAVGGGTISLLDDLAGSFGVVLICRGSWCPYCNAQLASFARAADTFAEAGIKVVAFSVDDEATSAALVDKRHLPFPVGHSADADADADKVGRRHRRVHQRRPALPAVDRIRARSERVGGGRARREWHRPFAGEETGQAAGHGPKEASKSWVQA